MEHNSWYFSCFVIYGCKNRGRLEKMGKGAIGSRDPMGQFWVGVLLSDTIVLGNCWCRICWRWFGCAVFYLSTLQLVEYQLFWRPFVATFTKPIKFWKMQWAFVQMYHMHFYLYYMALVDWKDEIWSILWWNRQAAKPAKKKITLLHYLLHFQKQGTSDCRS